MSARGPAWEGRPGDPVPAPLRYDPQTAPLPYGIASGDPYQPAGPYLDDGPGGYGPAGDGWVLPRRRRPGRVRRLLRWLVAVLVALVVLGGAAFGLLYLATPSVQNAPALARAIDRAHHVSYPGPPVPTLFAESLVATEDHRFYSEPGIDVFAVARVAAATVTGHGAEQGGATLYQQLAKMLYTPGRSGPATEVEQVMLGIKLDQRFSKAKILRMYADVAYFGHGFYGLAEASCGYFGTVPAGLTLPEAATLAGLVQGPTADDPIAHYAQGRAREAHVLSRLVATGKITAAQSARAYAQGLDLAGGHLRSCMR
jgi:membrane peptidoglycan carboxypeptidase